MSRYVVYGRSEPPCSYCDNLKTLLDEKRIPYVYKDISEEDVFVEYCRYRLRTVPAVFKDGEHIGGFSEIKNLI